MAIRKRRTVCWVLSVLLVVAIGAASFVAALFGRPERVDRLWASAAFDTTGHAVVTEAVDYDFANNSRHGIFRVVPGLDSTSDVTVSSPDAPSGLQVTPHATDTELRIGDPSVTVRGQHRYDIRYRLSTLANNDEYAWNVSGTDWTVGMDEVEGHLVAPFELTDLSCVQGAFGSQTPCTVTQSEPGHLVAHATGLGAHEGVTVYAHRSTPVSSVVAVPAPPQDRPARTGVDPAVPAIIALVAAAVGVLGSATIVLRAGRERVATGGAADVAWASGDASSVSYRRVDALALGKLATVDFAPPTGLSPSQGGVLVDEVVTNDHKAAWLMQASIDGFVDIEGKGRDLVVRRNAVDSKYATPVLDQAFRDGDTISLAGYSQPFSAAWQMIGADLDGWRKGSGLWDPKSDVRVGVTRSAGVLLFLVGAIGSVFAAFRSGAGGPSWFGLSGVAALVFGAAVAAVLFAPELRVRTPQGSGLWLRTESFRRFLHESEAQHVEFAAEHDMLREYTAWAVALGEVDRWTAAMNASSIAPELRDGNTFLFAAPYLASAASAASTAPSSSGSSGGGFGGGSVGGGGGGGGGGSW
jgi:hypothetical protein